MFLKKFLEKIKQNFWKKSNILRVQALSPKSCPLRSNEEVYGTATEATDIKNNMAHAHCMLDTQGYKHTYRIYNIYRLFTAITVTILHYKYIAFIVAY